MRRIKMITGAVSKSIRRQKEQRLASVSKTFFKDGSTKFGRERIDRALNSIYGFKIPQRHPKGKPIHMGLTKAGIKYRKKHKSKIALVKTSRQKVRIERDNMNVALWAIKKGYV